MKKLCPDIVRRRPKKGEKRDKVRKKRPWGYSFPDLSTCLEHFEKKVSMKLNWD